MSDNQLEVTFHNNVDELGGCCLAVSAFLEERGVGEAVVFSAKTILEELVGNTIEYGYGDDGVHEIVVTLTLEADGLEVQIEDDAREFSPIEDAPGVKRDEPRGDASIGGGLKELRRRARDVQYYRVDERNVTVVELDVS